MLVVEIETYRRNNKVYYYYYYYCLRFFIVYHCLRFFICMYIHYNYYNLTDSTELCWLLKSKFIDGKIKFIIIMGTPKFGTSTDT